MKLKDVIKSRGHTYTYVANKLGLSLPTLASRLNTNVSMEKAKEILNAIDYKIIAVPKDRIVVEGEYTL